MHYYITIILPPCHYTSVCRPHVFSQAGGTPVIIAAHNNHVAALELLIKANADVNKALKVREIVLF